MKPTRDAHTAAGDDDEIVDLDVIASRRVTFTYRGRAREVLPITTERLFAFWAACESFKKRQYEEIDEANRAFYEIICTVCDDVTLSEAASMTLVQKTALLEHIARKITGQKAITEDLKKKLHGNE